MDQFSNENVLCTLVHKRRTNLELAKHGHFFNCGFGTEIHLKHPETLHRVSYWWMNISCVDPCTFVSRLSLISSSNIIFINQNELGTAAQSNYALSLSLRDGTPKTDLSTTPKKLDIILFQITCYLPSARPTPFPTLWSRNFNIFLKKQALRQGLRSCSVYRVYNSPMSKVVKICQNLSKFVKICQNFS